jgi:hypothetical protein
MAFKPFKSSLFGRTSFLISAALVALIVGALVGGLVSGLADMTLVSFCGTVYLYFCKAKGSQASRFVQAVLVSLLLVLAIAIIGTILVLVAILAACCFSSGVTSATFGPTISLLGSYIPTTSLVPPTLAFGSMIYALFDQSSDQAPECQNLK